MEPDPAWFPPPRENAGEPSAEEWVRGWAEASRRQPELTITLGLEFRDGMNVRRTFEMKPRPKADA